MVLIALFLCVNFRPILGEVFQPFANFRGVVFRPIGHHRPQHKCHELRLVSRIAKVSDCYVRFRLPGIIKLHRTCEIELIMGKDEAAPLQPFPVDGPEPVEPPVR